MIPDRKRPGLDGCGPSASVGVNGLRKQCLSVQSVCWSPAAPHHNLSVSSVFKQQLYSGMLAVRVSDPDNLICNTSYQHLRSAALWEHRAFPTASTFNRAAHLNASHTQLGLCWYSACIVSYCLDTKHTHTHTSVCFTFHCLHLWIQLNSQGHIKQWPLKCFNPVKCHIYLFFYWMLKMCKSNFVYEMCLLIPAKGTISDKKKNNINLTTKMTNFWLSKYFCFNFEQHALLFKSLGQ